MKEYTWEVKSTDDTNGTMVVEYTYKNNSIALNIPAPDLGKTLLDVIPAFAPISAFQKLEQGVEKVAIGASGVAAFPTATEPAIPNVSGNINEEYLRALIFQVLEEIQAAKA